MEAVEQKTRLVDNQWGVARRFQYDTIEHYYNRINTNTAVLVTKRFHIIFLVNISMSVVARVTENALGHETPVEVSGNRGFNKR